MISGSLSNDDDLEGCPLKEENGQRFVSVPSKSSSVASSLEGNSAVEPVGDDAWGRAIDRYVTSVLDEYREGSQPDELRILSHAQSVSNSFDNELKAQLDDVSFAPINPFNESREPTFTKKKIGGRLRHHWKILSLCCFAIAIVLFISAGIAASKNKNREAGGSKSSTVSSGLGTTVSPTLSPINSLSTDIPTFYPTTSPPTKAPSDSPSSESPTIAPTTTPTRFPTNSPTTLPTPLPTALPTITPTENPSFSPTTKHPTNVPTLRPRFPSVSPTNVPSTAPSMSPTLSPTSKPTKNPSVLPTRIPSTSPTYSPTTAPSKEPTSKPTSSPTSRPSIPDKFFEMKKAAIYVSGEAPFESTSSAQSLAFHWLYYEGNPSRNIYEYFEQYALAVTFFSLTRARMSAVGRIGSSSELSDFTKTREVCGWEGVRCAYNYTSDLTHVTEIRLAGKQLTGSIPSEIRFLPYLIQLDLADNQVVGTIPEDLYSLQRLRRLYLNKNKLQGTISPKIDELNEAQDIYLGQNGFTGTLPPDLGSNRPNNWRFFSVYDNRLTGNIPVGMKLRNTYMLDFSHNQFYGVIPTDIGEEGNYGKLRLLYLNNNLFSGTIPPNLMQMRKLKGLFLNNNLLVGGIPDEIHEEQKGNLLTLRVQNNQLTVPISPNICELNVNEGEYELVELGTDCEICNNCSLCVDKCY